jgi:hypothetical protein
MQQRGECPPLLVVFDSCEGYFLELMALSSLLSWNLSIYNSKFVILCPKFDICMHTTGVFVCAIALDVPVSHTQISVSYRQIL